MHLSNAEGTRGCECHLSCGQPPQHKVGPEGRGAWSRLPCLAGAIGARLFQATCHVGASTVGGGGCLPVALVSSGSPEPGGTEALVTARAGGASPSALYPLP